MQVHIFEGALDHYGYTQDASGSNLPTEGGPWKPTKTIDLERNEPAPRIGFSGEECLDAIQASGFYVNRIVINTSTTVIPNA